MSSIVLSCSKTYDHDHVISNVNIIDVITGEILTNRSVAIDSDTISAIYHKYFELSDHTNIIDGTDHYLIPGLWDMHVHYNMTHEDFDQLLIANGVTGVREMWGVMSAVNDIRIKAKSGKIIAPDIYSAGNIIDGHPAYWPGSIGVSTPEEVRKVVNDQIDEGVDFIKVYSFLSEECFLAIADAANQAQIPFAGHVPDGMSLYQTIDAGMYCSEHMDGILMACSSVGDSLIKLPYKEWKHLLVETFSEEKFDSLCSVLATSKMWLCPTLAVNRSIGYLNDTNFIKDSRLDYMSDFYRTWWNPKNDFRFQNANKEKYKMVRDRFQLNQSLIGRMSERGVKFIAGTDFPNPYCFPGFSLHDELSLLVDGGMSELEALRAATINGAIFMSKEDEFGTVEVGKLASLVLLNDNPLENIENTQSIEAVILRGEIFDRVELDNMLQQVKDDAAKIPYSSWLRSKIESDGIESAIDSFNILYELESNEYLIRESDINSLGYEYLGAGKMKEAIAVFKKNTELFPESFNVFDSYAEALMADGQYNLANENFKKVLELDPQNNKASMMIDSIYHN